MELDIVFDYDQMLQFDSFNIEQLRRSFGSRINGTKLLFGFPAKAAATDTTEEFFRTAARLRAANKVESVG